MLAVASAGAARTAPARAAPVPPAAAAAGDVRHALCSLSLLLWLVMLRISLRFLCLRYLSASLLPATRGGNVLGIVYYVASNAARVPGIYHQITDLELGVDRRGATHHLRTDWRTGGGI